MSENPKAFVIMPFDPEFTPIYEQLIKPALEEAEYEVLRADSFFDQQNILRDIIRGMFNSDLVVAELTTLNANVLYELGLCHGLRIPTIMLAQSIDEIPFDLRSYRTLIYSTNFNQVGKLKQSLFEIATRHQKKEIKFGNPVTDFLPIETADVPTESKISTAGGEITSEPVINAIPDEGGILDFIVEGTASAETMNNHLNVITEETVNIGNKFTEHALEIEKINNNPIPGGAAQIHKVAGAVASDIHSYCNAVEKILPEYEESIDHFIENYSGYLNWITPTPDNKEQILEFRKSIVGLHDGAKTGLVGLTTFRDAIKTISGISREVNRASRRLYQILERVLVSFEKVEAFGTKALILIDEKLAQ